MELGSDGGLDTQPHNSETSALRLVLSSVNAKQLAQPDFQSAPSRCKSGHGCHSNAECGVRNANCPAFRVSRSALMGFQGAISSARRSAKAEVRGANARGSASFRAPVPQQLQDEFRKLVFVGATPTRGSTFNVGHDVIAASRPVTAAVPVQVRLANPISMTRSKYALFRPSTRSWFAHGEQSKDARRQAGRAEAQASARHALKTRGAGHH